MKILCAFGKYQYGDASRGIGIEFAAFIPALKRLGHEIIHFDTWDRSLFIDYARLNQALIKTVVNEKPDILLSVQRNYEIWTETLDEIREKHGTATISWTTDDSWKYREVSKFIGRHYDAMTTTYPDIYPKYKTDGIPNVHLTQWGANSHSMNPPIPAASCRYQVSFVGAAHGDRREKVDMLKSKGISVQCFGHGWPKGPVHADKIPEIIRNSEINLNFSNSKGENQLKARVFEIPGAGGFLLSESTPGLDRYYEVGKHVDVFTSIDEATEKIQHYLKHPEIRDAVAKAGFERTQKEHSYDMRMAEVVKFALVAKEMADRSGTEYNNNDLEDAIRRYYRHKGLLKFIRFVLSIPTAMLYGRIRGARCARRFVYEMSWRFLKAKTYSSCGLPGRMYPEQ